MQQSPITKTYTRYRVSIVGEHNSYGLDNYSKYHERLNKFYAKEISYEEIYGYEQAVEHANEIRNYVYDDRLYNLNKEFTIDVETVVVTSIPIDPERHAVQAYVDQFFKKEHRWQLPYVYVTTLVDLNHEEREQFQREVFDSLTEDDKTIMEFASRYITQYKDTKDPLEWIKVVGNTLLKKSVNRRKFLTIVDNTKNQLERNERLAQIQQNKADA